ncbi:unnamed protein product [Orchesella dallaii]|uniref:Uncharacterized protein n=1 Tax=Orchesella dallaii TaxID=48710 RepID=A0ABP1S395_9HEXA
MPRKTTSKPSRGKGPATKRRAPTTLKPPSAMPTDGSEGEGLIQDPLYFYPTQSIPPLLPMVKNLDSGDVHFEFSTGKLFTKTELNNPIILYGQPFFGKTFIFEKTMESVQKWYRNIPNHWVHFISLKDAAKVMKSQPRPRSFIELCARCLNTPHKSLGKLFKPLPSDLVQKYIEKNDYCFLIEGELFLDGLDEMPTDERTVFLSLLSQVKRKREEIPVRIWLSARTHLRSNVELIFGLKSSFEITGYDLESQMNLIHSHIRNQMFPNQYKPDHVEEEATFTLTQWTYSQLSREIKNFESTIGSMPCVLITIAQLLIQRPTARVVGESIPLLNLIVNKTGKEVIDAVNLCFHENYKRKFGDVFPFHKMTDLIRVILQNEYHFDCDIDHETIILDDELLSMGFLVNDGNLGAIKFQNRTIADYWLAKYFSIPGRPVHNLSENAIFSLLFFDKDAKDFRKFYDMFMLSVGRSPSPILRGILVEYYKLGEGMEEEWGKIKDEGTVLHFAIMEGFHRIATTFLDAFSRDSNTELEELKKLLMMRAPVDVEQNRGLPNATKKRHLISTLSMVALFGYSDQINVYFETYKAAFTYEEIQHEFEIQNQWTPLHYAAAHSNLWFIMCLAKYNIIPTPGIFNPEGRLALHLLMTYHWNYSMVLKDHAAHDDDLRRPLVLETKEGSGSVEEEKRVLPRRKDISVVIEMIKLVGGNSSMLQLGHHECFRYMLQIGEDFNLGTKPENITVFQYAAGAGLAKTKQFLHDLVNEVVDSETSPHSPEMNISDQFVQQRQGASSDKSDNLSDNENEDPDAEDSNADEEDDSDDVVEEVIDEDGDPVPDATRSVCKKLKWMDLWGSLKNDEQGTARERYSSPDSQVPDIDDNAENGEEEEA